MYKSKEQGRIITKQDWQLLAITLIAALWFLPHVAIATIIPDVPEVVDYEANYNNGNWDLLVDTYGYGEPTWDGSHKILGIENIEMPEPWTKDVWLTIDYQPESFPDSQPAIYLVAPIDSTVTPSTPDSVLVVNDDGIGVFLRAGWHWKIDPQPYYEALIFPTDDFYYLNDISNIRLRIDCIPEPTTLCLLGLGGLALRRKRRAC